MAVLSAGSSIGGMIGPGKLETIFSGFLGVAKITTKNMNSDHENSFALRLLLVGGERLFVTK